MCGLAVRTRGDEIVDIRGDDEDPFSRGHVCPKAVALADVHRDPDRLRQPVRRTARGWEPIGWAAALDLAARRLAEVQQSHGTDAVAVYFGNPTVHSYGAALSSLELARALGTRHRYSATSVDQLPHHLAATLMFGHQLLLPIPDLDRTSFFLVLGANPVASNGSLMTAPGVARRLKELRARGGRLVVVDPRRSETARVADQHLAMRPGTDALLLFALLEVLFAEKLADPGRLRDLTTGWDEIAQLVADFPPERVAVATGVAPAVIRELARDFAAASASGGAVCYGRFGVSTQEFGALAQWLIQVVNVVTGNLDRVGGAMFTRPAFDVVALGARLGQFGHPGKRRTRLRGLPSFGGELPVATLAEEMLTPEAESEGGEGAGSRPSAARGPIRALVTAAGNPVLSSPNGAQLERALPGLDFMVSVDLYINETTRHADLILPPTFGLERDHYDVVFHALAVRNTAKYARAVFPRGADQRHDFEILRGLAERLSAARRQVAAAAARSRGAQGSTSGSGRGGSGLCVDRRGLLARVVARWLTPRRLLALGLRFGPYGAGLRPFSRGLTLARLEQAPHGLDFGPLEPCLPGRLYTPDRRIQLAPPLLVGDVARLERRWLGWLGGVAEGGEAGPATAAVTAAARESVGSREGDVCGGGRQGDQPPASGALVLIGRRHVRSNNSWLHNSHRLVKGPDRCTLMIHPDDAAQRGVVDGEVVRVRSRVGSVDVAVEATADLRPGVVSLPHGWGHHRPGIRQPVAAAHAGVSVNDLTDELLVDELSGNAAFTGVEVWVERLAAP